MQIEDMPGVGSVAPHHSGDYRPITVNDVKKSDNPMGIKVGESEDLRSLTLDASIYNKNDITDKNAVDGLLEDETESGIRSQKNMMVLASETMSAED